MEKQSDSVDAPASHEQHKAAKEFGAPHFHLAGTTKQQKGENHGQDITASVHGQPRCVSTAHGAGIGVKFESDVEGVGAKTKN